MTDDPRLSMLIKLLQMTTSDNDSEALVAIRKANSLVRNHFGGDWDSLLRAKVKIIADPFFNVAPPPPPMGGRRERVPPKPHNLSGLDKLA